MSSASVEQLIMERLTNAQLPESVSNLIIASLLGDDELSGALSSGQHVRLAAPPVAATQADPAVAYLKAISVTGFRGIGPEVTLPLSPGPGLTLVAGRNGSGKSSFAEAAELALTGDNKRWSGRTAVWRAGWRNLHTDGASRIAVSLAMDGQPDETTVVREWAEGTPLEGATAYAQATRGRREPLDKLGWSTPLELYRPFLSYSELGSLVAGRPSEMYDAMQAILGLDQLIDAEQRLNAARKQLDDVSKRARQALPPLLAQLGESADERARRAETALRGRAPDLGLVESLAVSDRGADDGLADRLRRVTLLGLPTAAEMADAVGRLAAADRKVAELTGTPAAQARQLAGLLTTALAHYAGHRGEPCPVCAGRVLDDAWADTAKQEVARLTEAAREAEIASGTAATAFRDLRDLIPSAPAVLAADFAGELDAAPAREAWRQWTSLTGQGSHELTTGARVTFTALAAAIEHLQAAAAKALQRRSDAWQPVGTALAGWAELARAGERAASTMIDLKAALAWLRTAGKEVRNARLAPFAEMSARVWEMLRQESNVELGPIRLEGTATQRHVSMDVTIDGKSGTALSVMSQGELHALGLALFLPRATAADSPFRFLVIDDPVQSMDPAKVDGLARLLAQVATDRQVIVFTHDDRLPEALRRLQLAATVWEVVRRERSVIEIRKNDDPVRRYLDDARALARTTELPESVRAIVVAGFCRSALEAACQEAIRARWLAAGSRHAEVEEALAQAQTLHQIVTLALFDDARRGDQVTARLHSLAGPGVASAFRAAKAGTHAGYAGDLPALVQDTARLASALRR